VLSGLVERLARGAQLLHLLEIVSAELRILATAASIFARSAG